jgi:hypothetical protein
LIAREELVEMTNSLLDGKSIHPPKIHKHVKSVQNLGKIGLQAVYSLLATLSKTETKPIYI